jgi:hypothetical protein
VRACISFFYYFTVPKSFDLPFLHLTPISHFCPGATLSGGELFLGKL